MNLKFRQILNIVFPLITVGIFLLGLTSFKAKPAPAEISDRLLCDLQRGTYHEVENRWDYPKGSGARISFCFIERENSKFIQIIRKDPSGRRSMEVLDESVEADRLKIFGWIEKIINSQGRLRLIASGFFF